MVKSRRHSETKYWCRASCEVLLLPKPALCVCFECTKTVEKGEFVVLLQMTTSVETLSCSYQIASSVLAGGQHLHSVFRQKRQRRPLLIAE